MTRYLLLIAGVFFAMTATQAHAQNSENDPASSTSTTVVPSTGALGQSTAPLNPATEENNRFGMTVASETDMLASSLNYANNKDKSLETFNYIGLDYKINKNNVLGFRQYVLYSYDGSTAIAASEVSYPVLTFTKTFAGLFGTDPVSAMFWYYAPTPNLEREVSSNGTLRADVEFDWTLNPKVTVGYYMNPRQTVIPTEVTLMVGDKPKDVFAKTTLIHWAAAYYNINDSHIYYVNAGMRDDWKTRSNFDLSNEQYLLNLGASYKFFGGNLTLNPEIDYATPETTVAKLDAPYSEDNITYLMTVAVAF